MQFVQKHNDGQNHSNIRRIKTKIVFLTHLDLFSHVFWYCFMPFHGFVLQQLHLADKFVNGRVGTPKFGANHACLHINV